MATPEQKAFCVLQFVKHESVVFVHQACRRQFNSDPPSPNSIRCWYQQFQTTGCLCKGKSAGRPGVSEENVERVRQSFLRGPKKSVRRASCELEMSSTTVWRVLRKSYSFISTSIYKSVHHTFKYNQFPNCCNHFDTCSIGLLKVFHVLSCLPSEGK